MGTHKLHIIRRHIYLLVIAAVSLHLVAIFYFFHFYAHYFVNVCIRDKMFELFVYLHEVHRCIAVAVQWNIYVQCGNHISSVIYLNIYTVSIVTWLVAAALYVYSCSI